MPYAKKFKELSEMSRDQLVNLYDATSPNVTVGLNFIREEIAHRDTATANATTIALTRQMRTLTIVITILTVINAILVLCSIII